MSIAPIKIVPITPDEIVVEIPEFVIAAFNSLIVRKHDGKKAYIRQSEVVDLILALNPTSNRQDMFNNRWLDIEPLYEQAGWEVKYNKPYWNEPADPSFTFTKKEHKSKGA